MQPMTETDILVAGSTLPKGLNFMYYAEGAANVVYKIEVDNRISSVVAPPEIVSLTTSTTSPGRIEPETWVPHGSESIRHTDQYRGKLLRLRKDLKFSVSPLKSQHDLDTLIRPLFQSEDLLQSVVVTIDEQLVKRMNAELKVLEKQGVRPSSRFGTYLRNETHATVVDDIGYGIGPASKVVELKPKWLLQSPDAPANARRCRTCALRMQREFSIPLVGPRSLVTTNNNNTRNNRLPQVPSHGFNHRNGFCPIDLASRNRLRVLKAIRQYVGSGMFSNDEIDHIVDYLVTSSLLERLKHLQATLYPGGLLQAGSNNINLLTLMTLRDCSLFLIVSPRGVTGARLSDLDLKSAAKVEHWKDVESQLVHDGWYEKAYEGVGHIKCALEN